MFGWDTHDTIGEWLNSAERGHAMEIDCEGTRKVLNDEIERAKAYAEKRVKEINDLLNNPKYFKQKEKNEPSEIKVHSELCNSMRYTRGVCDCNGAPGADFDWVGI